MPKYDLLITAMTRDEAQPAWGKIVDIGCSNYDQLTNDQKIWFNIEPLTTGGIVEDYINHGAEYNKDTLKALEFLGFPDIAEQIHRINKLFKNGQPPTDIMKRNEDWDSWSENHKEFLDDIENNFWTKCSDLENALMDHINRAGIGID
jgi:hypothetical protein